MDVTTVTPAEIDAEISRLNADRHRLGFRLTALRRLLGEAENREAGYASTRRGPSSSALRTQIAETERQLGDAIEAELPLAREFVRRGGWTRWYLVPDGHLHYDVSGDRCSRIPTTDHYWMTEFSDKSAEEMIELAGDRVCTMCFPDAPVVPRPATARFMTPSEAERVAYREQAARVRAAKKAAQITTPDGRELRAANGIRGDLIKTEIAARRRALSDATDIAFYGVSHPSANEWRETVTRMIAALAHRTGTDIDTLRAEINDKVAKRARREDWTVRATI